MKLVKPSPSDAQWIGKTFNCWRCETQWEVTSSKDFHYKCLSGWLRCKEYGVYATCLRCYAHTRIGTVRSGVASDV